MLIRKITLDGLLNLIDASPFAENKEQLKYALVSCVHDDIVKIYNYMYVVHFLQRCILSDAIDHASCFEDVVVRLRELGADFDPRFYTQQGIVLPEIPKDMPPQLILQFFTANNSLAQGTDTSKLSYWAEIALARFVEQFRARHLSEEICTHLVELLKIIIKERPNFDFNLHIFGLVDNYACGKFLAAILQSMVDVVIQAIKSDMHDITWRSLRAAIHRDVMRPNFTTKRPYLCEMIMLDLCVCLVDSWMEDDLSSILCFNPALFAVALGNVGVLAIQNFVSRMNDIYFTSDYFGPNICREFEILLSSIMHRARIEKVPLKFRGFLPSELAWQCRQRFIRLDFMSHVALRTFLIGHNIQAWLIKFDPVLLNRIMVRFPGIAQEVMYKHIGVSAYQNLLGGQAFIAVEISALCLSDNDLGLVKRDTSHIRGTNVSLLWLLPDFGQFAASCDSAKDLQFGYQLWSCYKRMLQAILTDESNSFTAAYANFKTIITSKRNGFFSLPSSRSSYRRRLNALMMCCKHAIEFADNIDRLIAKEKMFINWPGMQDRIKQIDEVFLQNQHVRHVSYSAPASFVR